MKVAPLTGGKDTHYVLGLVRELAARGVQVALVGSEELAGVEDVASGRVEFHNLVGSLDPDDGPIAKVWRVKRRGAWFPTAARAAAWFAQRRSAVFDSVRWEGPSARVRASTCPRRDLPGLTIRVHTPGSPDDNRPIRWQRPGTFTDVAFGHARDAHVTLGAAWP